MVSLLYFNYYALYLLSHLPLQPFYHLRLLLNVSGVSHLKVVELSVQSVELLVALLSKLQDFQNQLF